MLGRVHWELAILRLLFRTGGFFTGVSSSVHRHRNGPLDFPPTCDSYERLASLWGLTRGFHAVRYDPFLRAAGRYFTTPIRSVLDLACGTGELVRRLAGWAELVVGLDASEAMLREARLQSTSVNVCYVRGDFASFRLDQAFDAITCCGDSINYLQTPGDLTGMFERVRAHLVRGGLFLFDTLDHRHFKAMARIKEVVTVGTKQYEVYYFYDSTSSCSETRVLVGDVIERHRRIPLGRNDVYKAAANAGLDVVGYFSISRYFTPAVPGRQYYVLRNPI
jgi:SAM-dependent methyltransferase